MIKTDKKKLKNFICITLAITLILVGVFYYIQNIHAHKEGYFVPDYPRIELTPNTDYQTIFEQTGLGKSAAQKLIDEDKFDLILEAQETFFNPPNPKCNDMFSFFVKEDRMDETGVDFVDLQPGDILLSLSTHSFGWRHGHAGLVIDDESVLESEVIGTKSKINPLYHFGTYSNYAVLRIKDVTPKQQEEVVAFAKENLQGVWYSVAAGFVGDKAPSCESDDFRVQCAYLVWYAYNYFGYDLDSDGGCLVSTYDILHSDKLEIVQIFGMNPKEFTN